MCPYELALKLHELGVNSESEFYFVKEMKGGGSKTESVTQNTMRYSYRKEGDLIPAYMSHELGEILPSMINIGKSKIWDDWLELAGYSKEEDGPSKWMREQVIEAVALFSSHGNSGFSAPFEINLVKKLCSFDIISPLRFDDGEWEKIGLDGSCQNKRKSSIFKEPDGSIHDVDAFSKVPVKKFLFATRTWTENIHKIGWIGGLFETDENGILTGRYFGRCNVKDYQNGYMPKGKKEIPCREIEISPDNWIMTVESNNEALIELSKIYDIVWRQCPCLKGIMNTNVTPELERLACEQMKG